MTTNGSRRIFTTILILTMAALAHASGPGSFDLTFAGTGHKFENFGSGSDGARDVALQQDGKIVVVGRTAVTGSSFDIAMARFNADGSFDTTFSDDGKLVIAASTPSDYPGAAVAVQLDGKIVVAGWINVASSDEYLVLRFNTDGTPDLSFDGDGRVITPLIGRDRGGDVALQPDGKIVIAGSSGDGSAMIRYNSDGSFDTAFGGNGNGITFVPFIAYPGFRNPVAVQADGKVLVAGMLEQVFRNLSIARFNLDGTPDASFGTNGILTTPIINFDGGPGSIALTADGKIVAAGFIRNGNAYEFAIARYNANSSPDTGFSGDGLASAQVVDNFVNLASTLVVQANGAIVAGGYTIHDGGVGNADFALLRVNADGSLDTSFDGDGKLVTPVSSTSHDILSAMVVQPDGKLIAAGYVQQVVDSDFALVRYNANGSLDGTFGSAGIVAADIGGGLAYGRDVVVQPDGKIVAAAEAYGGFALVRYNADSSIDTSFGTGGKAVTSFTSGSSPKSIMLQPDGKIVVAGSTGVQSTQRTTVVRYNSNGSLDNTFDGDGKMTVTIPGSASNSAASAVLAPDGKIVVIAYGFTSPVTQSLFTIVRINTNGSLDTSFDVDGMLVTLPNIQGNSVAVQPDGGIIVGGGYDPLDDGPRRTTFSVARYKTDGSTDTSFGGNGVVITPVLASLSTTFTSIALLPDGRIVACGRAVTGSDTDLALVRYNANGSLDQTFDGDGIVTTPLVVSRNSSNKIAIQSDGKIVATADSRQTGTSNIGLVRYNVDGSPDTAYGNLGAASFPLGYDVITSGLTLDAGNNAVLVAGTLTQFLIARVTADYAPQVEVGGRVTSTNGQGISGATVILTDAGGNPRSARTNAFGYYGFSGVFSNEVYTVRVSSKRYRFQPSSQTITVTGSLANIDFLGNPGSESKNVFVVNEKTIVEPRETIVVKQTGKRPVK